MTNYMTTIGEIAEIYDGPHATPEKTKSGPYLLSISSLENGRLKLSKSAFLSEKDFQRWTKRVTPQKGDILFSYETRLGEAALMPEGLRACLGRRMGLLRPKINKVTSEYLLYAYISPQFQQTIVSNTIKGATVERIALNKLPNFKIRIPNIDEQKNVAGLLTSIDSKIELNNKINTELEAMAKALYDYWFVQFDFPNKDGKPYKTSGGQMVWNDELKREIPAGWIVGTLLDIAEYTNGLPCQKFRPTGNEFLKVIKIREMRDGFSSDSELVRSDIPQKVIIENGDVLFSWSASLEVQIWTRGKGALNQHIFKVTSKDYPKSFYFYQLINYLQHFKMLAENRKTTMGHITQEHLQQSRIGIPPKELTVELEKIIAPVFKKKMIHEVENQKLIELRDWLLPMLMNGQVTVN